MSSKELTFEIGRVAAFNDAVIAIAITLLVLNVAPELSGNVTNAEVRQELVRLFPHIFSFALSFWVISRFWISNQMFFKAMKRMSGRTLSYNLLLLFVIALLPFPTELIASVNLTHATIALYAGTVAAASFIQAAMWNQLTIEKESRSDDTNRFAAFYQTLRFSVSGFIFLASIPAANIGLYASIVIWVGFGFTRLFNEKSAESIRLFEEGLMERRNKSKH